MGMIICEPPNISDDTLERFSRRVYVPVTMVGVGVLSLLVTPVVIQIIASLLFPHVNVPSWAGAVTTGLWGVGVWGVLALPFLYVLFGIVYGYAQKRENDETERPVVQITTLAGLIYGMICRVTLHIMRAVGGDTSTTHASLQSAQTHLVASVSARRESHARPPRLCIGRSATSKEAGHVRLATYTSTSTVAIAPTGGAWA
jgi:hypothetical protein